MLISCSARIGMLLLKKRNIMDGILSLQEIFHHTHVKKQVGVVLKLDFEKAYDKVNWDFLLSCHQAKGLYKMWCGWIKKVLYNGTVSVKLNNVCGTYFQSYKGVRQGDPLSPTLFNLAGLWRVFNKNDSECSKNGLLVSLVPDLVENGVVVLQYADDTVLCISHDAEKAMNLKLLLYMFELMSRA
jgi:hypothetical protein